MKTIIACFLVLILLVSCDKNTGDPDAYGNFEAEETLISAETSGKLLQLNIREGDVINAGYIVAVVDTMQLYLQKEQMNAKKMAITSKFPAVVTQAAVLEEQLNSMQIEQLRIQNLMDEKAATQKQLDDINGQIKVIEKQIENVKSQNAPLFAELEVINAGIDVINDQINRASVRNPIKGTVLNTYAKQYELMVPGKVLYKIADMKKITLRAYVSETQLTKIQLGDTVRVAVDSEKKLKYYKGVIAWVSDKSEFTPKIIQTREERVNLVYAIKIHVVNNGSLKIGMPAEVYFK